MGAVRFEQGFGFSFEKLGLSGDGCFALVFLRGKRRFVLLHHLFLTTLAGWVETRSWA